MKISEHSVRIRLSDKASVLLYLRFRHRFRVKLAHTIDPFMNVNMVDAGTVMAVSPVKVNCGVSVIIYPQLDDFAIGIGSQIFVGGVGEFGQFLVAVFKMQHLHTVNDISGFIMVFLKTA